MSKPFHREIIPLELVDTRFYHLDTCLCPLSGGELLYFPDAFDPDGHAAVVERIALERRVSVPQDETLKFACTAVCIGKHVALPPTCPASEHLLQAKGYQTHSVLLDEFMKSVGSAKSLTLALD